ncbi:hypothetical protein M9458_047476, partial [Cirrhinus mrigala]
GKVLLFPTQTDSSYVKLIPEKPLSLSAFTLCMRVAIQIYRKGNSVKPGVTVLLGQDPDTYVGGFEAKQSFVGEITELHMWDYVLSGSQIKAVYSNQETHVTGNVFDWNAIMYEIIGNILEAQDN